MECVFYSTDHLVSPKQCFLISPILEIRGAQLERMRGDTCLEMAFSNVIAFFIIRDTGAVLRAHGITDIQTGAQAAEALRPLVGELAFVLFSLGIIGTGLMAILVLRALWRMRWPRLSSGRSGSIVSFTMRKDSTEF
jgi:Mn2+/Fe2+ NRAMP family transporter